MLYPFIYTRTKYHDYRVVTSQSLGDLHQSFVQFATEVARTLIDVDNDKLVEPSWALVKKDEYVLWGMAALNSVLGDQSQDKYKRPVRGFFGFISDNQISKLPYDISYFKSLYEAYVLPIWDSYEQTKQIVGQIPAVSGFDFIEKTSRLHSEINVKRNLCRFFPSNYEGKDLIEAVFSSFEDSSIATNMHKKKQCIEFGKDKASFANAIISPDTNLKSIEDIEVFVRKENPIYVRDLPFGNNSDITDEKRCPICGRVISQNEDICTVCKNAQQKKKYIRYVLYGFIAIICLLFVVKGPSIWKKILSSQTRIEAISEKDAFRKFEEKGLQVTEPFLTTNKSVINISDATINDIFRVRYNSSSKISRVVSSKEWIHVTTHQNQYAKSGEIEFNCEPFDGNVREGSIEIINEDGNNITIVVNQSNTNHIGGGVYGNERGCKHVVNPSIDHNKPSSMTAPTIQDANTNNQHFTERTQH